MAKHIWTLPYNGSEGFLHAEASDVSGYKQWTKALPDGASPTEEYASMGATGEIQVGSSFITAPIGEPKTLENPTFTMQIWSYLTGGTAYLRAKVYRYRDGVETLLFTTSDSDAVPTSYQKLVWAYQYSGAIDLLATDRLVVKIFANRTVKATGKRIYIAYDHSTRDSRVFDPETRYLRSDTHTVNGLTARKLGTDLTGSVTTEIYRTAVSSPSADFGVRFFRRLADGTEVEIISSGTPIIVGTRTTTGSGLQSVNISVAEIALNPTDAIIVRCYYRNPATTGTWTQTGWDTPVWITPQLNALKLNAATWTVYLYTIITPSETAGKYDIGLGFGSSNEPSRIENFTWTPAPVGVPQYIGDGLSGVVVII